MTRPGPVHGRDWPGGLRPAEEAFIVTIGVPHEKRNTHCRRALEALERAGFRAGPTSTEALMEAARQAQLSDELAANDPPEEKEEQ